MMRLAVGALAAFLAAGPQDSAQIAALVKKLDSPDWVEQAQAAKELAKIGQPALGSLRAVMLSDSPSAKYWASAISEAIGRTSGPVTAPPPAADPEPASTPNPRGFAPGANDMGSLVFICNNPSHDAYEVVFSRCLTCSKVKRFAYDYGADVYRCAVCKKTYEKKDLKCDRCGQPPAPRMGIRMKSSGG
jgi:hypothetical protein